jgi:hypothetical protein
LRSVFGCGLFAERELRAGAANEPRAFDARFFEFARDNQQRRVGLPGVNHRFDALDFEDASARRGDAILKASEAFPYALSPTLDVAAEQITIRDLSLCRRRGGHRSPPPLS